MKFLFFPASTAAAAAAGMSRHGAMVQSSGGSNSNIRGGRYTVVVFEAESGKRLDVELPEGQQDGTDELRRELFR